jgi:hypothetical protein
MKWVLIARIRPICALQVKNQCPSIGAGFQGILAGKAHQCWGLLRRTRPIRL